MISTCFVKFHKLQIWATCSRPIINLIIMFCVALELFDNWLIIWEHCKTDLPLKQCLSFQIYHLKGGLGCNMCCIIRQTSQHTPKEHLHLLKQCGHIWYKIQNKTTSKTYSRCICTFYSCINMMRIQNTKHRTTYL